MRSSLPGQARGAIYDRNPLFVAMGNFSSALAPHGTVTRDSYTVPAGRRAKVSSVDLQTERITVATTAAQYSALISSGANAFGITFGQGANAVGDHRQLTLGDSTYVTAGDVVVIQTFDSSTGGTVSYQYRVRIIEFDI